MSKQNNDKTASDSDLSMSAGSEYLPEMVVIRKDWIYKGTSAIRNGRDSLQAELFRHDRELGRSILRNKRDAEDMERDIAKMDTAIRLLNDFIPGNKLLCELCKVSRSPGVRRIGSGVLGWGGLRSGCRLRGGWLGLSRIIRRWLGSC